MAICVNGRLKGTYDRHFSDRSLESYATATRLGPSAVALGWTVMCTKTHLLPWSDLSTVKLSLSKPCRHMEEKGYSSTHLNLGTRWRYVFIHRPLTPGERDPGTHCSRRPDESQCLCGRFGEEESLPYRVFNTGSFLYGLRYPGSTILLRTENSRFFSGGEFKVKVQMLHSTYT
jgi:hypothetical protein